MPPQQGTPEALLAAIAQSGNEMAQGWMRVMAGAADSAGIPPWLSELQRGAAGMAAAQAYAQKQLQLWTALVSGGSEALAQAEPGDRRFSGKAWRENSYYDYLSQSYLLASRYVEELVEHAALEPGAKERARFAARQWIDSMSPANFAATNPEALAQAIRTQGESLTRGLANLLQDAAKGRISQTDEAAFEVGRNVAVTPGEVIYENELIQLIQYAATTAEVAARPLVMIPPCINKFYILDLQPESSLVAHAIASGQSVFMVSWRNVGPELGHLTWDDYLEKGVFAALRAAREIAQSDRVNALGFCVGGTLLGAALAVLAEKNEDLVASATFLATMHDFRDPGQIGLFIDEASVAAREAALGRGGILPGSELAYVFSSLRANDLVWPYVVNNYRGEQLPHGRPAGGVRSAVLEFGQHQPARADVLLLPAQHLSREQAAHAGRAHELRRAGGPRQGAHPGVHPGDARGPHRALALGVPLARAARRQRQDFRARGERPRRGRGQSAGEEPPQLLAGRDRVFLVSGGSRRVARQRSRASRQLVAEMDAVALQAWRRPAQGTLGRRRCPTQADRARARSLREAANPLAH